MERCGQHRLRSESGRAAILSIFCVYLAASLPIRAQGITTAALGGTVRAQNGEPVEGALVRVVNLATGYATETQIRRGAFVVQGLATGGPYRVIVRSLGYSPQVVDGLSLTLGERRDLNFTLVSLARQLDTVKVTANEAASRLPARGGVGMSISDSALRRLPTLNRDLYDFVRLVPQVSTRQGVSGAGTNYRFNSYVIDGVSDRQLQGNITMGGSIGGKSISLDAIKEYQVLLSPYEARYGDFAGLLVNAITKSGTNEVHGSAYGYVRNEQLARANSFVGSSPYRREQFGFSLGGPVVRNRIHFFIAPEFQRAESPATGPYVGQSPDAPSALPVTAADVTRFASLLRAKGLDAGDGGRVMSLNPATTLFGRVDIALPEWNSRAVLLDTYSTVDVTRFARANGSPTFPLSSNAWTLETAKRSTSVQVFTQASPSTFNELVLAYMDRPLLTTQITRSPSVQASVTAVDGVGTAALVAGPPTAAGGSGSVSVIGELADHLVLQVGPRHTLGAGIHIELFVYHSQGVRGSLGQWRFSSLDSLFSGDASSYSITKDFGSAQARSRGAQPSAYVSDEWHVNDQLSLTLGLRADVLKFSGHPAYNAAVDSVFQRRTSDYPRARVQWSPRLGFGWQPFGDDRTRVRGGAGIFVGPPPIGWLVGPMRGDGAGLRTLTCTGQFGQRKVPKFVADAALQPQVCPDGRGFSDGPVALVDRNLRMAESFRTSLAVDRRLPWKLNATAEALYTRVRSDFLFVNANLPDPQGIDAHGRVLYGSFDAFGRVIPANIGGRRFTEAIDLRNNSLGHSWSVTAQVDRPFSDRFDLRASYTHSRTRDVQSLTNASAVIPFDIWASGRPLSGRHDDLSTGVSSFEIPHRVVLAASYVAPWKRWKTDISLYYVGESGSPFTYGDSTAGGLGDLNADGTSANDPIYVPLNASDPAEIQFSGVSDAAGADNSIAAQADRVRLQQNAFEQFIRHTPCLRRQRGTIVSRNSCNGPWLNTSNASVRQSLQEITGRDVSLQLEVFNLLNLVNQSWGLFQVPNANLLRHVGQTFGASAQPVFHFDPASAGTSTQNLESSYQLQVSLRYSF